MISGYLHGRWRCIALMSKAGARSLSDALWIAFAAYPSNGES
jgi:hypothetical protein